MQYSIYACTMYYAGDTLHIRYAYIPVYVEVMYCICIIIIITHNCCMAFLIVHILSISRRKITNKIYKIMYLPEEIHII